MIGRRLGTCLAGAALVLGGSACLGNGGAASGGELRVASVSGRVTARPPGEPGLKVLAEGDRVPVGSEVHAEGDASVRLSGANEQSVELLDETRATLLAVNRVALDSGRVLAQAGERPVAVVSRGVTARTSGSFKVLRGLGTLSVGVYSGSARVELLGRGVDVPALREVVIAGGIPLDRGAVPLSLSANDLWDRRLLGDVLDFDRELEQFGRGFNSEFGAAPRAPAFFAGFVPLPDLSFVGSGDPSEVLVGLIFSVHLAAREGGQAALPDLFSQLRTLREQGATWGLIAKEKGLDLRAVIGAVVDAIRRGTTPPAPPSSSGGGGSSGGSGGSGGPRSTPTPRPTSPSPTPTPTASPSPRPTQDPCGVLERLLGQCSSSSSAGSGGGGSGGCSVVGVLLDPDC